MENKDLYVKAALGDKVDEFFRSPLGQYIIKICEDEIEKNRDIFESIPFDAEKAKEAHFNISVARKGLDWLNWVLIEGRNAEVLAGEQ